MSRSGLALALALALLGGTVGCSRRDDKTPAPTATRPDAEEIAQDQDALDQLRAAGSNLSKPHQIDFYMVLPSQSDAESAGNSLRALGYRVTVRAGDGSASWVLTSSRTMMPTIQGLTEARVLFKGLALRYRGAYAGWQAAIEH
jgi:hypothetical protein